MPDAGGGAGHGIQLPGDDDQADAGEHALDHGHRDGAEPAPALQGAQYQLEQSRGQDDHAQGGQAVRLDGFVDQDGQARGRSADLETAARQQAGEQAADDSGDQAEFGRDPRGDGDAHAQREGDKEDDKGGGDVTTQDDRIHGRPRDLECRTVGVISGDLRAWQCGPDTDMRRASASNSNPFARIASDTLVCDVT